MWPGSGGRGRRPRSRPTGGGPRRVSVRPIARWGCPGRSVWCGRVRRARASRWCGRCRTRGRVSARRCAARRGRPDGGCCTRNWARPAGRRTGRPPVGGCGVGTRRWSTGSGRGCWRSSARARRYGWRCWTRCSGSTTRPGWRRSPGGRAPWRGLPRCAAARGGGGRSRRWPWSASALRRCTGTRRAGSTAVTARRSRSRTASRCTRGGACRSGRPSWRSCARSPRSASGPRRTPNCAG